MDVDTFGGLETPVTKSIARTSTQGLGCYEEADELDDNALGAALTAFGEAGKLEIRYMQLPAQVRGIFLGNYRSREEIIAASQKHPDCIKQIASRRGV